MVNLKDAGKDAEEVFGGHVGRHRHSDALSCVHCKKLGHTRHHHMHQAGKHHTNLHYA